jgi:cytochrome c-type biogenesis protein CcmH/NrfF
MRRLAATIFLLALALPATLQPSAATATVRAELTDIEDEVMCPICGTALNLSGSPQADRERAYIRRLIAEGKTKRQIKDALVAEYGPRVLAVPPKSGFDLTAWLVPIAALVLAATAIATGLRRWRRQARGDATEPSSISPEESQRLDADLANYDP